MVAYPSDWEVKKLGEIFDVFAGGDVKKNKFSHVKTSKYQYEVFSNGVNNKGLYGYTSKALYPANSLTVSARGTIGQAFFRDKDFDAVIRLLVLIPQNDNIQPKFYEYYINSQITFEKENTGVAQLTAPKITNYSIPLPPLAEQKAIADTLGTFDAHIKNLSELIEKKKAIRDGALEDLMTGRTRLKGFSGGWEVKKLGDCATILQGGTPNTSNQKYWNGNIVWVTPSEITKLKSMYISDSERKITHDGLINSSATIVPTGTILLCSRATIGDLAIATKPMTTNQGFKNLVSKENINNVFLAYLLLSLKKTIISLAIGTTFLEISKKNLSSISISLPPLAEQQAIAETLTAFDDEIKALEAERDKIIKIRDGAMNDLLTGKIRLKF